MDVPKTPNRSRVPWALALAVGLASGLAGYVVHAALVKRIPKQVVEVQRLTDMVGPEETPAISPDGKSVAFVAASGGRKQIWVERLTDGGSRVITKDDVDHEAPRWSPDSSNLIYFTPGAIWEIPDAGGEAHKLVDALAPGDLSHDGRNLAFFRLRDGTAELAAGDRTIVKLAPGSAYSNLRWSPDDKKIAYLQDAKIMVVSASGGDPVQAAQDLTLQGFAWAPDNSGLIISSGGPPVFNLWFVPRIENRSPLQLTFGELSYESPDISAGGNLVVSRRSLDGRDSDIVMFSGLKW
ncbi:MAG: Serine/threonine protein kinase [Bryobacterales bacterium]|nr:Serine/threonine protein kinase [Bryobacterales bacterium]